MLIKDVFLYDNKTAIYISMDDEIIPDEILFATINGKRYDVLKHDKMESIIGKKSLTLLLDTQDDLELGLEIVIE